MFLFILGLQSRLMRWPIATIVICVITVALSLFESSHKSLHAQAVQAAATQTGVWAAKVAAVQNLCGGNFLPQQCQFLQKLKPQDFANLEKFFASYKRANSEDKSPELRKWQHWLTQDQLQKGLNSEDKAHPSVTAYEASFKKFRILLVQDAKKNTKLMRGNLRIAPAIKALFLHEGWGDLLASLMVFALFSVFLEQRVGAAGVVLIYILGGAGGNFFQSAYLPFGVYLVGAGAAVSATLGAFVIYFYQEKSHLVLRFGTIFQRRLSFPAWTYAASMLVLAAVINWFADSEVNYLAYIAGFALGAIIASMQKDLFPLKKTFLFPHEQAMYYAAKKATKFDEKLSLFHKIYRLNRESFYAYRTLFAYFEKHHLALTSFKVEDRELVNNILLECFRYNGKNEKMAYSQQVLGLVPLRWNLGTMDLAVTADQIIDRAHEFQAQGFLVQGIRYYDLFLEKYAAHPRAEQAHSVIMQVFDELERFDNETRTEILDTLLQYQDAHPMTHFQSQIRRVCQHVDSEKTRVA